MKIAIIVPAFPTLSETFILNHITGLIDEGHDVSIIALYRRPISQKHQIIDDYKLLQKTVYVRIPKSKKVLCRLDAILQIFRQGFRCPFKTAKLLKHFISVGPFEFYQKLFFSLALLSVRCDLYHFHFGNIGRLGIMLKAAGLPIKMITSFHGYDVNSLPLKNPKNYYDDLFRHGDHFVTNTEFTRQQVINLGCDCTKISVIPVGLHIRDFQFRSRTITENEVIQILTVGRLVEKKGYQYSIRAIARLVKDGFNIHYTIAGDGPLRDELETLCHNLGVDSHITFYGGATQEEITKLYDKSHLFVLTSITASDGDKEGQALVLQEAQACGLPVISTYHNGIPDGVLDGKTGYLVPEKDVNSLYDAIKKLLLNSSLWMQMGKTGRDFVIQKYDMPIITLKLVELYQSNLFASDPIRT
jgi:colanic acid/amylovoran biosynthesis glycosyltransferase